MLETPQVLHEIRDRVHKLGIDVTEIKTHLQYLKEHREELEDDIENLCGRVDKLEDIETKRAGGKDVWRWVVSIVLGIMAIMQGLDAWKNFVN